MSQQEKKHEYKGESITKKAFAEKADINNIMKRYERTGILGEPGRNMRKPIFGDFSSSIDFMSAQNAIIDANNAFMSLSAKVRRRFNNDAYQLMRFLENEDNRKEAIELGLIDEKKEAVQEELLNIEAEKAAQGAQKETPKAS